jgi:hypothetical protein
MKKSILLLISMVFSFNAYSLELTYEKGNNFVVKSSFPSKAKKVSQFSKQTCGSKKFCLVWFVVGENEAANAVKVMKGGDLSLPTPGLYAIFSRNKVANEVICYDDKYWC